MSCGVYLLLKGCFWILEEKVGLEKTGVVAHRECLACVFGSETANEKKVKKKEEGEAGRQTNRQSDKHFSHRRVIEVEELCTEFIFMKHRKRVFGKQTCQECDRESRRMRVEERSLDLKLRSH